MKTILSLLLGIFSLYTLAQEHHQPPQQHAVRLSDNIADKIMITKEKKDSLTIIFKRYFDDLEKYKGTSNEKIIAAVRLSRDGKVHQLLANDEQYITYKKIITETEVLPKHRPGEAHGGRREGGSR